jgi:hypothetical protein
MPGARLSALGVLLVAALLLQTQGKTKLNIYIRLTHAPSYPLSASVVGIAAVMWQSQFMSCRASNFVSLHLMHLMQVQTHNQLAKRSS